MTPTTPRGLDRVADMAIAARHALDLLRAWKAGDDERMQQLVEFDSAAAVSDLLTTLVGMHLELLEDTFGGDVDTYLAAKARNVEIAMAGRLGLG